MSLRLASESQQMYIGAQRLAAITGMAAY